jgi:glycosyltransferase involved in cell wall biosynthesis
MYLSGGEGYGLMPQEAMATGLPMIVANNTGMKEYLTPQNALLVECPSYEKCDSMSAVFNMDLFVTKPNYDQAVEYLRWAYNNRETLPAIGEQGHKDATRATWEEVALEALFHIREYAKTL